MNSTSNEKFCCKDYQVVEEGKTFWKIDDFYPTESKSCESVMPCAKKPSSQKSCAKKACQSKKKHKNSCKRPTSAGPNQCTGKSSQQISKKNSECAAEVPRSPPNKECVVILHPNSERKNSSDNFNQDGNQRKLSFDNLNQEPAEERSSGENMSCRICSSMQNRSSSQGSIASQGSRASRGSQGSRGSQDSQGSRGSQGFRGSQEVPKVVLRSSNASEHSIKSERKSSSGSIKQESRRNSATLQSSSGTGPCKLCSSVQQEPSQNADNAICQQLAKPNCDIQAAKQSQIAIKMCIDKPQEDNMNCGDITTQSTGIPCNIMMDFSNCAENGRQPPKRVQLSLQLYISGDQQNSAHMAIENVDCCSCNQ